MICIIGKGYNWVLRFSYWLCAQNLVCTLEWLPFHSDFHHNCKYFLLQILKILKHGSVRGLSVASFELEVVGYTIALAYCIHKGLPFSAYGELAFLLIQGLYLSLSWLLSEHHTFIWAFLDSFSIAKASVVLFVDLLNWCLYLICSDYLGCNHLLLLSTNGNQNMDESFIVSFIFLVFTLTSLLFWQWRCPVSWRSSMKIAKLF